MNQLKWSRKKPKFKENCLLMVATWNSCGTNPFWSYKLYGIQKSDGENEKGEEIWYWVYFAKMGMNGAIYLTSTQTITQSSSHEKDFPKEEEKQHSITLNNNHEPPKL